MSTEPLDFKSSVPLNNLNPKLWYLYGKPYNFNSFIKKHPGGEQAILLGRGRDCTALFESYHTNKPSKRLINEYKVDNNNNDINIITPTFTFNDNGFYNVLKKKNTKIFY